MKMLCRTWVFLLLLCPSLLRAEIVYDNSQNYLTNFFPSLFEFGDEIRLAGSERLVTNFVFEYFGDFAREGDETARIRFYANDGEGTPGLKSPGTLLFDSGPFAIFTGHNMSPVNGVSVVVPDSFTWTVEFGGLTGIVGDQAGLVFYHPPLVGKSFRDFWINALGQGGWALNSFPGFDPVANFGARVQATESEAPEVKVKSNRKLANGSHQLEFSGGAGQRIVIEYSGDLTNWSAMSTNQFTSDSLTFVDEEAGQSDVRFYRASVR